jgi:hypothetical protein
MAVTHQREELVSPGGLLAALRSLFPTFGDEELLREISTGDASTHTVLMEFSGSFDAASAEPSQLAGLASLLRQCVAVPDCLENAAGTCFLEHLHQTDKRGLLWKLLSPVVFAYVRIHCRSSG